ncbi:MAG: hypothetical protein EZS28_041666, partial [Streblomastix strix]
MLPKNVGLVLTARGGIYAYCYRNGYKLPTNGNEKVIVYDDNLEIDIFAQMYTHKDGELVANRVVLPNSIVRIMEKGVQKKEVLHYKELNDWSNAHHLASLHNILGSWNVDLTAKDDDISNTVSQDCTLEAMPIEIADACIQGLKVLTIHNDTNTLAREISLLPLFMGLNGLEQTKDKQYEEDAYTTVYRNNILTPKANEHWSDRKGRYSNRANAWILTKIIKLHNKEYYETTLKPLLKKRLQDKNKLKHEIKLETIEKQGIDINDPFTFGNISEKATRGEYKEEADIATDLTKVIRYYAGESGLVFIIKEYDAQQETNVIRYKTKTNAYEQMHIIRLWDDGKKQITVQDIFEKYSGQYVVEGVRFNSDNPNVFNVFQGFQYEKLEQVDESKIDMFINDPTYRTIAGGNREVFEYILNWIAFIAQNAEQKTRTAIILQGLQRIGKNRFTDAISEMFSRYSQPNISTIEEFTGTFNSVVENVMFAVLNEMMNYIESKKGTAQAMKTIIRDKTIRINEKNQPRRRAENVINTIIVTNNDYPIQLDNSDGRYL